MGLPVVFPSLVLVPHQETDGASRRLPLEDAREELHLVVFRARGGDARLSRPPAVQFGLNKVHVDGDTGGKSVYYASDGLAVRFPKGGKAEDVSE